MYLFAYLFAKHVQRARPHSKHAATDTTMMPEVDCVLPEWRKYTPTMQLITTKHVSKHLRR